MANYPNNDPSDGSLMIQQNNLSSSLVSTITAGAVSMTLQDSSDFPAQGFVTLESEAIEYGANATATGILSSLTRGADSTTAAQHDGGVTAYSNVVAAHHNRMKDEVIAIGVDLRNCFDADLNDAQAVSTTAVSLEMRLDQISTRIAALGNSADWKSGQPGKITNATQSTLLASTLTASITFVSCGLAVATSMGTTTTRAILTVQLPRLRSSIDAIGSYITILRGATDISNNANGLCVVSVGASTRELPVTFRYIDSPNTTGSVTYTVHFKSETTTSNAVLGLGSMPSIIIAESLYA